jgi:hypothetical protein
MRWPFIALVTVAVGLPAFLLSRVIWPDTPASIVVPPELVPFFALPSLLEALAFLLAAGPIVRQARSGLAIAAYLGTAWVLMAAWPHGNLHRSASTW